MQNGEKNFNGAPVAFTVLVAPLDWGLGHATRCIPIIKTLISQGCQVVISASGAGYSLLKKEFPSLVILRCKSPGIHYSKWGFWNRISLLFQIPKILFSYRQDRTLLRTLIPKYHLSAVISDNRFGMWNEDIPSVYLTHQLTVSTGNWFADRLATRWHRHVIEKYDLCWVPDDPQKKLSGALGENIDLKTPVQYLGPLSRFSSQQSPTTSYDILLLLSGPEPQRTVWETLLLSQLTHYRGKVLMVRGLPEKDPDWDYVSADFQRVNFLPSGPLNEAMAQSRIVISRCGYTTIMDLVRLSKRAILVPTPGQGEQEYLARYLMEKKYFYCTGQRGFSLEQAVRQEAAGGFKPPNCNMEPYGNILTKWIGSLKSGEVQA